MSRQGKVLSKCEINKLFFRLKFCVLYNPLCFIFWVSVAFLLVYILIYGCSANVESLIPWLGYYFAFILVYWNLRNQMFQNLFAIVSEFNNRYDRLNDYLNSYDTGVYSLEELKIKTIDYFNLCAEEYYFYSHGLVPNDVWTQWENGMKEQFHKEFVKLEAIDEFKNDSGKRGLSYYGFDPFKLRILED